MTPVPPPTATPTTTATATATPTATATSTRPPTASPTQSATPQPTATAQQVAVQSQAPALAAAPVTGLRSERLVLASYFAWYDDNTWNGCAISAGDRPLETYNSDDPAAISRHVRAAKDAGIDGFTLHWVGPGDRTDHNFATLLAQSAGAGFHSTVVFSRHFAGSPAATLENVASSLRYIIDRYSSDTSFLRLNGKPVIFFTDMPRVPSQSPVDFWAAVRALVDPSGSALWIAEGLDASYLAVFDGLYVLKITHADYPDDYVKASRWAGQVRAWEQKTGKPKLWLGTITPGWDDLRAGCQPDVRVPSTPHKCSRDDGAFYRATFDAALASSPDILYVYSFNEWIEGTYIEPGVLYKDAYLQLTREFAQRFRQ